jgi:type 1 glutamine amidotransferase
MGDLKALVVLGGHDFEHDGFFGMLDSLPGISYDQTWYPEAADSLQLERASEYDAIVFYDYANSMSERQREGFLETVRGGKGLVFLHHASSSHTDWPEYRRIVGGHWDDRSFAIDDAEYGPSTFHPDQRFEVRAVDRDHPITEGIEPFTLEDETYGNWYIDPSVSPLLETDDEPGERILGWTHTYGPARVVYLQPGHGEPTYSNDNYRRLIVRSISWVAQTGGAG